MLDFSLKIQKSLISHFNLGEMVMHMAGDRELANICNAFLGTISINGKRRCLNLIKLTAYCKDCIGLVTKRFLGPIKQINK